MQEASRQAKERTAPTVRLVDVDKIHSETLLLQPGAITMSCLETLKSRGMKLTPQRRLIVEIIHENPVHITAEELISNVQDRMPGVNKSTIYRTLEFLEESGCVYKSEIGDQFVYHHADEGHHHHLVCSKCGRTVECEEDLFSGLEKLLAANYGFSVSFRHQVVNGLCRACREETAINR